MNDIFDEIEAADDLGRLHSVLRIAFLNRGFEAFAGGIIVDGDKPSDMFLQAWPADWTREYLSNGYAADDPIIPKALTSADPFTLDDVLAVDPDQKVTKAAVAYGWKACLIVPIHGPQAEIGLVCLASRRRAEGQTDTAALSRLARAAYFRGRALRLARSVELSPRQREALTLAAAGLSDDEIGERLNISRHTAHSHIEGAKRSLGARSRAQAVATATERKLI